ncbi:putative hit finger domain-containing protein [Phaeoacremonium minimum UCRPA7]|uniref:Putative hit finger domain-containing protein n=1 Tax=Phaeoacremonium minimum (strain UCR-PA7) TaxID=1286976 RepID=R8BF56_PHAM7|nr:putative hit finger domain-containing protein [Phaeoacremonium minimum UCRPA7]EON97928.1 putative hit finger domain-containing protein [Phaeoacremonium minimum UCRPA7]
MNNFGVIEVASTRTTHAPGWAYIPDLTASAAALQQQQQQQPTSRKRARNQPALSSSDVSARHDARVQKELAQLNRDNFKDVSIAVPPKTARAAAQSKSTPNVRKILASQKTFANHLDDFEAQKAQLENNPAAAAAAAANQALIARTQQQLLSTKPPSSSKRSGGHKKAPPKVEAAEDVEMADAAAPSVLPTDPESAILAPYTKQPPAAHPADADPLLETNSWVPPLPTDDELRELMTALPLNYNQARGTWGPDDARYPPRHFCELCGYWGRVRCMKCGTRVCALDCLELHREECVTRFGY